MRHKIQLFATIIASVTVSACAQLGPGQPDDGGPPVLTEAISGAADPSLTAAPKPPAAAKTQEAFDTTTPAQRKAAAAPVATDAGAKSLGVTVVSLGSPTEPGFWLKTPLVASETTGRVTNKANGKSSAVTLIPIDGPVTGGSRLSLPAMRVIGASVTDLTEVEVTQGG